MCGRVEHYVAAAGHGAVASLLAFGALPPDASGALSSPGARVAVTALMAAGAVPMAGGKMSPDLDAFGCWKRVDRMVPDEWLLFGGPMRHRGILHWWGLPAAATWGLWWACTHLPLAAAVLLLVVCWPPVAGVWSHLLSDFFVGARYAGGKRPEADDPAGSWDRKSMLDADDHPRGPGIPVFPWWGHIGVGWRVGSVQEWMYVLAMIGAGVGAGWASWHGVSLHWDGRIAVGVLALAVVLGVAGRSKGRRSPGARAARVPA